LARASASCATRPATRPSRSTPLPACCWRTSAFSSRAATTFCSSAAIGSASIFFSIFALCCAICSSSACAPRGLGHLVQLQLLLLLFEPGHGLGDGLAGDVGRAGELAHLAAQVGGLALRLAHACLGARRRFTSRLLLFVEPALEALDDGLFGLVDGLLDQLLGGGADALGKVNLDIQIHAVRPDDRIDRHPVRLVGASEHRRREAIHQVRHRRRDVHGSSGSSPCQVMRSVRVE
jgi:hypothetical protein